MLLVLLFQTDVFCFIFLKAFLVSLSQLLQFCLELFLSPWLFFIIGCNCQIILLFQFYKFLFFIGDLLGQTFDLICQQLNITDIIYLLIIKSIIVFFEKLQSFLKFLHFPWKLFLVAAQFITQIH